MGVPIIEMTLQSGLMGLAIIIMLGAGSLLSWAIILNRFLFLGAVRRLNKKLTVAFDTVDTLQHYKQVSPKLRESPAGVLATVAVDEFHRIIEDAKQHRGVTDWSFYLQNQFFMAQERMQTEVGRIARKQDWGLYLLAVISSAAPFLGLLGTVWGIMNSFFEIGSHGSASLQVVAPGIAEALITTIAGLIVAIPAVIFYNIFLHKAERIEDELDEFSDLLILRMKRELFSMMYTDQKSTIGAGVMADAPQK